MFTNFVMMRPVYVVLATEYNLFEVHEVCSVIHGSVGYDVIDMPACDVHTVRTSQLHYVYINVFISTYMMRPVYFDFTTANNVFHVHGVYNVVYSSTPYIITALRMLRLWWHDARSVFWSISSFTAPSRMMHFVSAA